MPENKTKYKKRNYKTLYILTIFIAVFGGFIYLLIKPSTESTAMDELEMAGDTEAVRACWDRNKPELAGDADYLKRVRDKLSSFHLSQTQTDNCLKWLPKPPESLNIIVVPDLSGRIDDTLNN